MLRKVKAVAARRLAAAAGLLLALSWTAMAAAVAMGQAPAVPAAAPPVAPTGAQAIAEPQPAPPTPQAPARSSVYSIHNADAIRQFVVDPTEVHTMVDRLVLAATGKDNIAAAWRSLVTPKDIVGIKISATGGTSGSTHKAVVARIVEGLLESGVPRENILVWDRDADDLRAAGYLERDGRTSAFICPVLAIEPKYGYDAKDTYTAPFLGKLIWGDLLFKGSPVPADRTLTNPAAAVADPFTRQARPGLDAGKPIIHPKLQDRAKSENAGPEEGPKLRMASAGPEENLSSVSHYCTLLAHRVTKIINVPVFIDNGFCGVGGALYNVTIPNVDNWRRLVGPPQYGQTAIPEMFSDPQLGGKVVLNIADGLIAQIAGGPQFAPLYARHLGTLYASKDAVALDSVMLHYLEIWRAQAQLPALGEMAGHVRAASELGLGNAAPDRIDLRSLN